jgi:hypothetical protein
MLVTCSRCNVQFDRQMGRCPICREDYRAGREEILADARETLFKWMMSRERSDYGLLLWLIEEVRLTDEEATDWLAAAKTRVKAASRDRGVGLTAAGGLMIVIAPFLILAPFGLLLALATID